MCTLTSVTRRGHRVSGWRCRQVEGLNSRGRTRQTAHGSGESDLLSEVRSVPNSERLFEQRHEPLQSEKQFVKRQDRHAMHPFALQFKALFHTLVCKLRITPCDHYASRLSE